MIFKHAIMPSARPLKGAGTLRTGVCISVMGKLDRIQRAAATTGATHMGMIVRTSRSTTGDLA